MNLKKLQEQTEIFVDNIHPIILGPNKYKDVSFGPIIEGALRRDYLTLRTILFLSERPEIEHIIYGDSCMDLSRKVVEDLIALEFMELKNKTKQSNKFKLYKAVERMRDLSLLQKMGAQEPDDVVKFTNEEFEKVKNKFKDKRNEDGVSNSPFGLGVEGMIDELLKNNKLDESGRSTLGLIYILGCRTIHFSPTSIFDHSSHVLLENSSKNYIDMSLLFTFTAVVKITLRFFDEIENLNHDLVDKVMKTWDVIKNADDTNFFEYDPVTNK
jgi:hypothetical protein